MTNEQEHNAAGRNLVVVLPCVTNVRVDVSLAIFLTGVEKIAVDFEGAFFFFFFCLLISLDSTPYSGRIKYYILDGRIKMTVFDNLIETAVYTYRVNTTTARRGCRMSATRFE